MPPTAVTGFMSFTPASQISSIISGSVSCISSLSVISFIFRSQSKLKGAYHRIMFCMSFWDVVSSLAIAATTLPMPADVHEVYSFAGAAVGNVSTCEAQAFLIILGSAFTLCSNCALNLYYLCTIRFGMTEETFNKIMIPAWMALAVAISVPLPVIFLSLDLLNPVVSYPYCVMAHYPYNCEMEDGVDCIRGGEASASAEDSFQLIATICLGALLVMMLVSLILVILSVFETEMMMKKTVSEENSIQDVVDSDDDSTARQRVLAEFDETRTALRQALMYIVAFLMTWMWSGLSFTISGFGSNVMKTPILDLTRSFFQPLQGFFNALIFFYCKVCVLRAADDDYRDWGFFELLKLVITSPQVVPGMFISRLEMIGDFNDGQNSENESPGRKIIRKGATFRRPEESPMGALSSNRVSSHGSISIPDTDNNVNADGEEAIQTDIGSVTQDDVIRGGPGYDLTCHIPPSLMNICSQSRGDKPLPKSNDIEAKGGRQSLAGSSLLSLEPSSHRINQSETSAMACESYSPEEEQDANLSILSEPSYKSWEFMRTKLHFKKNTSDVVIY